MLKLIKTLILICFLFSVQSSFANTSSKADIQSYKSWKNDKVTLSKTRIDEIKKTLQVQKSIHQAIGSDPNLKKNQATQSGISPHLQNLNNQLDSEIAKMSLAEELSITDYFVGYLMKKSDLKQAIKEASQQLSPEEVAELMTTYAETIQSQQ